MKIVIDSNRIIASLLKDSTTRRILQKRQFEFIAPEFVKQEIVKYKNELLRKSKLKSEDFDLLLSLLFERITIIPTKKYKHYMKKSILSDFKDIPYLACALAMKADGIWSHDNHFLEQNAVKIFTNKDLLPLI